MKKISLLIVLFVFPIVLFSYTLRVGDTIGMFVFGYPQYSMNSLTIGPDGIITVPPIGRIKVSGIEVSEVEKIISKKLQNYVKAPNVTIGVTRYAPFIVNIFGNVLKNGVINIQKDTIKLSELIALSGGLKNYLSSYKAIVTFPNDETKTYDISWIYNGGTGEDPIISENSRVVIPYENQNKINVFSEFGTTSFTYFNGITLKYIISNQNVSIAKMEDKVTLLRDGKTEVFSIDKVIKNEDIPLKSNDTIILSKLKKYVYVDTEKSYGKVNFEKNEKMTIKNVLAKLNINPSVIRKITVNSKECNIDSKLNTEDFVKIEYLKNYVYLSGSFGISGRVAIEPPEKLTLTKVLSLSGGFKSDFSGKLDVLTNGTMKVYNIDINKIETYKDIVFEPQSTIIAESEEKVAYIIGDLSDSKTYNTGDTLFDLLIKYQLNEAYNIEYSIDGSIGNIKGNEIEKEKNIKLKGKVILNISKVKENNVIVYKEGVTKVISKNKVTLMDIITSVKGFEPVNRGTLKVYKDSKLIKTYTEKTVWESTLEEVPMGSYVVVQPTTQYSYITILGNVSPKALKTDVPLNLVDVLASTNFNWQAQDEVVVYTNDEKDIVNTQDIEKIKSYKVEPGSIIFVSQAKPKLVYAFGEVNNQGVVEYVKGLTLLDYIFRVGGIKQTGEPSKVFLFKNGPENPPITLDISGIMNTNPIKSPMNPVLNPGDIIFVPKNALTGVFDVMNTVATFMNFIKTGTDTYTTVTNAIK